MRLTEPIQTYDDPWPWKTMAEKLAAEEDDRRRDDGMSLVPAWLWLAIESGALDNLGLDTPPSPVV